MSKIADSAIKINCSSVGNFIKMWLTFLTPLHKLTPTIINLAAEILRKRFELSESISNESILDNYLMTNKDITNSIMSNCNLSSSNYHVGITKDSTSYSVMLLFSIPEKDDSTREDL